MNNGPSKGTLAWWARAVEAALLVLVIVMTIGLMVICPLVGHPLWHPVLAIATAAILTKLCVLMWRQEDGNRREVPKKPEGHDGPPKTLVLPVWGSGRRPLPDPPERPPKNPLLKG